MNRKGQRYRIATVVISHTKLFECHQAACKASTAYMKVVYCKASTPYVKEMCCKTVTSYVKIVDK